MVGLNYAQEKGQMKTRNRAGRPNKSMKEQAILVRDGKNQPASTAGERKCSKCLKTFTDSMSKLALPSDQVSRIERVEMGLCDALATVEGFLSEAAAAA